ncbi:MAG: nitroreductase family protein [Candidatus Bathyarchaeia archaeon]
MAGSGLLNAILERASVRNFDESRSVSEEDLKKILLAGIRAPSAGNIQPRTFIVIKDEKVKEMLYELCENQAFMKAAPVWIVVCLDLHRHLKAAKLTGVDYDFTGILPYTFGVLDAALSLENMVIAAEALGLGSVIIGSIIEHPQRVKEILNLPKHCLALSILCIGHPKKKPKRREKWGYRVIVCENRYKDISPRDVLKYWKKVVSNGLKRAGKKPTKDDVEKICKERSYGVAYSNRYKEEFVKEVNKKLMNFLMEQSLLKMRGVENF